MQVSGSCFNFVDGGIEVDRDDINVGGVESKRLESL